jgi:hypothetical protein
MPWEDNETEVPSSGERIAVLGAHSPTGRHFCRLALDAGYVVQALIPQSLSATNDNDNHNANHDDPTSRDSSRSVAHDHDGSSSTTAASIFLEEASTLSEQLILIHGELDHGPSLEAVLEHATYVVCFMAETLPKRNRDYPRKYLSSCMPQLYPLMKEAAARVFLYQASWLTIGASSEESMPILSQVWKHVFMKWQRQAYLQDQDAVVRYMVEHTTEDWLHFIITRPGLVVEGPSRKKLHASKSVRVGESYMWR